MADCYPSVEDQPSPFLRVVDAPTCASGNQTWRNFWSTSFDQSSTSTLNVKSNSSCNRLMECLIKKFFPQPLATAHDDGLFMSKLCFEEVHILEHTNLSAPEVEKRKIASSPQTPHLVPSVLVAYELSINELENQRIFRVWEGLASPLAHLTIKSVP